MNTERLPRPIRSLYLQNGLRTSMFVSQAELLTSIAKLSILVSVAKILGQTAKHLHLRERRVAVPGACVESSVTEDDGWYIVFPEPDPGSLGTIANKPVFDHYEGGEISACRDTVITQGDFLSLGLLVFQEKNAFTLEVIALSSAPLDRSLFEAPRNYKKVDHFKGEVSLTWTSRLTWDWSQLIDSIATWF